MTNIFSIFCIINKRSTLFIFFRFTSTHVCIGFLARLGQCFKRDKHRKKIKINSGQKHNQKFDFKQDEVIKMLFGSIFERC